MSSYDNEVRLMLLSLMPLIKESNSVLDSVSISHALFGLQCMSSDHTEVCNMLILLTEKVNNSFAILYDQSASNALFGLMGMSSDRAVVRLMLKALGSKIQISDSNLSGQVVGNALYGLQNMSSDFEEVRNIYKMLISKVNFNSLNSLDICQILFGSAFVFIGHDDMFNSFIRNVVLKANLISKSDDVSYSDLIQIFQSLSIFSHKCISIPTDLKDSVSCLMKLLKKKCASDSFKSSVQQSHIEKRFAEAFRRVCYGNDNFHITTNEMICDCFETDILITKHNSDSNTIVKYNIEIDGPNHQGLQSVFFCKVRDDYLKKVGDIVIIRVPVFQDGDVVLDSTILKTVESLFRKIV